MLGKLQLACKQSLAYGWLVKENKPVSDTSARRRLLDAAREEFGEKGIEAATTRGIAERAGCNEVTLFRQFESKQGLLAAVVSDSSGDFTKADAFPPEGGDLEEEFRSFASLYSTSSERCEGMCRALIGVSRRHPGMLKELIGDLVKPFNLEMVRRLEAYREAGRIRADVDPPAVVELFTAMLMGGMLRRTSELSFLNRERWVTETATLFHRSLTHGL